MTRLIARLASLRLTTGCLLALGLLVLWGTLYQVEFGLYAAQQRFFASWVFLAGGFLPVPGTQLVLTVLFANLLASMLTQMRFGWRHAGVLLIHAGILLLLGGGFVIHHHAQESFLTLAEGEGSNLSASYQEWELAAWEKGQGARRTVYAADLDKDRVGERIVFQDLGLEVEVQTYYGNCRPAAADLQPVPISREPAENMPGGNVRLHTGAGDPQPVQLYGGNLQAASVSVGEREIEVSLRRKRFQLPLLVKLIDFRREVHPGSRIPKYYGSLVEVDTSSGARPVLIEMNKPLRYRGYTLYQASFSQLQDGAEQSTLAVVRNVGRLLPYAASILTFIGLVIHFALALGRRPPRREGSGA